MDRRGFLGWLGKGAAAVATVVVLPAKEVEAAPPARLSSIVTPKMEEERAATMLPTTGVRHFAILMNYDGIPIKTMMVDNLPQEIHIDWVGRTQRNVVMNPDMDPWKRSPVPSAGTQAYTKERSEFRLVSEGVYDGRTIEGLARYILFRGPEPNWPQVRLGF